MLNLDSKTLVESEDEILTMVRGNPKRFEGFKFNHGTSVGAGSPKPGEHHFFSVPPSFFFFFLIFNFINKFKKKRRAGNDQAYEPLTASSPKSGTGKKTN